MQLEHASLEQPDSRTKTLIRCLARKAKDVKRLDVFEHLRVITPAGTTGELVLCEASCHQWLFFVAINSLTCRHGERVNCTFICLLKETTSLPQAKLQ